MLLSMTGYGRATCQQEDYRITVELKSVNHRYLDVSFSLPREWTYLEESLKHDVTSIINRGKVSVFISVEGSPMSTQTIEVNWELFDQYLNAFNQINERMGERASTTFDLRDWALLPDLFKTVETPIDLSPYEDIIHATLKKAIDQLIEMRLIEGENLNADMLDRLQSIKQSAHRIQGLAPRVTNVYQERLQKRIQDLLSGRGEMDEVRVINEVAIFAEKTDITEEVTRLLSHLEQFHVFLSQDAPIGRKLDFLIQEMNREINTMGSKSPDVDITQEVVLLKGELEKIREQVQNIE